MTPIGLKAGSSASKSRARCTRRGRDARNRWSCCSHGVGGPFERNAQGHKTGAISGRVLRPGLIESRDDTGDTTGAPAPPSSALPGVLFRRFRSRRSPPKGGPRRFDCPHHAAARRETGWLNMACGHRSHTVVAPSAGWRSPVPDDPPNSRSAVGGLCEAKLTPARLHDPIREPTPRLSSPCDRRPPPHLTRLHCSEPAMCRCSAPKISRCTTSSENMSNAHSLRLRHDSRCARLPGAASSGWVLSMVADIEV